MFMWEVRPVMKTKTDDGKDFYDLYFIVEGKGANRGSVLKAKCMCKGGCDGGCKHIAAAMYSLEALLNSHGNDSATSGSCSWLKRPISSTQACEVRDLVMEKGKLPSNKKRKRKHTYPQNIDMDVRATRDKFPPLKQNLTKFTENLNNIKDEKSRPVILPLLNKLYVPKQSAPDTENKSTTNNNELTSILDEKLTTYLTDNSNFINTPDTLCTTLVFTEEEITRVNDTTLKQWQCKEWYTQKAGFITASKCKRVYTRQETLEKNRGKDIDVSRLVREIVEPNIPSSTVQMSPHQVPQNPREWGLFHEDSARSAYFRVERHNHHKIQLLLKGFLISNKKPFLGASLDNIRRCHCSTVCPEVVVEYKCPWKHRDLHPKMAFLTPEIGGFEKDEIFLLSTTSQYYFQVQVQMFVANLSLCDLVVWTKKGIHTTQVKFDSTFVKRVCEKLAAFWKTNVLSSLISRLSKNLKLPSSSSSGNVSCKFEK